MRPKHREYVRFGRMARDIFEDYTDRVEPFGLDEGRPDVTGSAGLFGLPVQIAKGIGERFRFELGITVGIGVRGAGLVEATDELRLSSFPDDAGRGFHTPRAVPRCPPPPRRA